MSLESDLKQIIHGEVTTDAISLTAASHDASIFEVLPQAIVHPMNSEDIKTLVRYASEHKGTSLTVRSAGTDMTGGPLNDSLIVDMSHFTRIGNIQGDTIVAEPGVLYRDFEKKTVAAGKLMPSYPASKDICTIGGMVGNNAGGEKTLLYGTTQHYIKELKVVLADGNEYSLRPIPKEDLPVAMKEQTFLGQAIQKLYTLLEENYDAIQGAKPTVSKNSAGYALWNVWDRETFDLTKLFTGSQGTLGITTEITFRLVTPATHKRMLVAYIYSLSDLPKIVEHILKYRPESFETYDDMTLQIALSMIPRFAKKLNTSTAGAALQFLPELFMGMRKKLPTLTLIAEFTGTDDTEVLARTKAAKHVMDSYGIRNRIIEDEAEAKKFWAIRRESFALLRNAHKEVYASPIIEDFIVEPKYLSDFLPKLATILHNHDVNYSIAGHIGNGNLHIIPLMNLRDEKTREIITQLSKEVHELVFSYHGSTSAEHNDGLIRTYLLPKMFGPEIYSLFEQVKQLFDPQNIFNPRKKVRGDWQWAKQHIRR